MILSPTAHYDHDYFARIQRRLHFNRIFIPSRARTHALNDSDSHSLMYKYFRVLILVAIHNGGKESQRFNVVPTACDRVIFETQIRAVEPGEEKFVGEINTLFRSRPLSRSEKKNDDKLLFYLYALSLALPFL